MPPTRAMQCCIPQAPAGAASPPALDKRRMQAYPAKLWVEARSENDLGRCLGVYASAGLCTAVTTRCGACIGVQLAPELSLHGKNARNKNIQSKVLESDSLTEAAIVLRAPNQKAAVEAQP